MNPTVLKLEELKRGKNGKFSGCLSVAPQLPFTHVELHPLGNGFPVQLHTGGDLWFRHSQATGTDAFPSVEESFSVLPVFGLLFGVHVKMSPEGRGRSLPACRPGALWHPSVLLGSEQDPAPTQGHLCVQAPAACAFHACNSRRQRLSSPLTDCSHTTKCLSLCPLQLRSLEEKCTYESYIHLNQLKISVLHDLLPQ